MSGVDVVESLQHLPKSNVGTIINFYDIFSEIHIWMNGINLSLRIAFIKINFQNELSFVFHGSGNGSRCGVYESNIERNFSLFYIKSFYIPLNISNLSLIAHN